MQSPGKGRAGLGIETDDKDLVWSAILIQEVLQGADRNFCRLLNWETVGAAADSGKGNGGEHILCGNLHTAAIAVCQQGMFVITASPPLRSDGMDNMSRLLFAALTMASTSSVVISDSIRVIIAGSIKVMVKQGVSGISPELNAIL